MNLLLQCAMCLCIITGIAIYGLCEHAKARRRRQQRRH